MGDTFRNLRWPFATFFCSWLGWFSRCGVGTLRHREKVSEISFPLLQFLGNINRLIKLVAVSSTGTNNFSRTPPQRRRRRRQKGGGKWLFHHKRKPPRNVTFLQFRLLLCRLCWIRCINTRRGCTSSASAPTNGGSSATPFPKRSSLQSPPTRIPR